jgi:uncharacterized membrane protein YccC
MAMRIAELSDRLRAAVRRRRRQLTLAIRVTIAALVAFVLAQLLELPLPLWAVMTAVIVTQMSVGRSLKATFDYLVGTLGGAIYGGVVGVLVPHASEAALLATLALGIAPLAFVAAINPRFSVAPITGIIVLLIPIMTHATPIASALDRVLEVALGGVTGLCVSFFLFRSNAHSLVAESAAHTLDLIVQALGELLAGLTEGRDVEELHRIQDGIGLALVKMNEVATEAEHERFVRLAVGPETGPLLRTLLRLRHDLVMIGRAAASPLPDVLQARVKTPLAQVSRTLTDYLRASRVALQAGRAPPRLDAVEAALEAYAAEIAGVRRDGLTRDLSGDDAERFFALGFALEQMRDNCKDLGRCVAEWMDAPEASRRQE